MKKFFFKIKGRKYDVEIKQFAGDFAQVDVNGTLYDVEIEGTKKSASKTPTLVRQRVDTKPSDAKIKPSIAVGGSIKAPLPGSIVKINVAVGDAISAGDTVMVMEAMKMENNIQAETAGTIKALRVSVGDTVMQDDILIELS